MTLNRGDYMIRGTTPTLKFKTPYSASLVSGGFITFSQRGSVVIDKPIDDESVTVSDNSVQVELTQKETLSLTTVDVCKIQVRLVLASGKRAASNVLEVPVGMILKDGEI